MTVFKCSQILTSCVSLNFIGVTQAHIYLIKHFFVVDPDYSTKHHLIKWQ